MDLLNLISLLGGVFFLLGFIWVPKTSADTVEASHINDLQDKKVDTDFHDSFLLLTDTPGAYAGEGGKFLRVNAVPDALEFVDHNKATHDAFGLSHDSLVDVSIDDHHAQIHAAEHQLGGGDAIKLDDLATPDDNADLDFSTLLHGLVPKGLDAGAYLKDDGTWDVPPGGGNVIAAANITDHTIVRGDGGVKGVQDTGIIIEDDDTLTTPAQIFMGSSSQVRNTAADCRFYIDTYGVGNWVTSELYLRVSNSNVLGTKSETQPGDALGLIKFLGVDTGSNFDEGAIIHAVQNGAAGVNIPTDLVFYTYSSTAANTNQLVLYHDGTVGIGAVPSAASYRLYVDGGWLQVHDNGADVGIMVHEDAGTHDAKIRIRRGPSDWYIGMIGNILLSFDYEAATLMSLNTNGNLSLTAASSTITGGTALALEAGVAGISSNTIRNDTTAASTNVHITPAAPGYFLRETSAKKYKTKIKDMELDSSLIHNLQCRSFNSLCEHDDKKKRWSGLIADEVEPIYPDMIHYNEDNEVESYDKTMLMTMLLAEVQKHEITIEALKAQLNNQRRNYEDRP